MIVSPDSLRKDTVALIKEIDIQIEWSHKKRSETSEGALASLLNAKATAYNTLVLLQTRK